MNTHLPAFVAAVLLVAAVPAVQSVDAAPPAAFDVPGARLSYTSTETATDGTIRLTAKARLPDPGASVPVAGDIGLVFDREVRPGTGTISITGTAAGRAVEAIDIDVTNAAQVRFDDKRVILDPGEDLAPGATYTVSVPAGTLEGVATGAASGAVAFDAITATFSTGGIIYAETTAGPNSSRGSGTQGDPYRSLAYASKQAMPGDTIYVVGTELPRKGYPISAKGSDASPIFIKPGPGADVHRRYLFKGQNGLQIDKDARHVVIEGFSFDGNSDSRTLDEMLATGVWTQDGTDAMGGIAINVRGGEYITIRDCHFHDLYQKAVNVEAGRYVRITGNIIHDIATRSLSGGHGIMRQQGSGGFDDADVPGVWRWDISGNLIFNTYQAIPSWVPGKGYLNIVLDEGKPILIDEPGKFATQTMTARISENAIAYARIDAIRLKSTKGLEVSRNTVFSTHGHADGITDRNTTGGESMAFPTARVSENLVFVSDGVTAYELGDVLQSGKAGAVIGPNAAVSGGSPEVLPAGLVGSAVEVFATRGAAEVFRAWDAGDFRVRAGDLQDYGVPSGTLADLRRRVAKWGVEISPAAPTRTMRQITQILLDNIPDIQDGTPEDGRVFTSAGRYAAHTTRASRDPERKAFHFTANPAIYGSGKDGPAEQQILLPDAYWRWYDCWRDSSSYTNGCGGNGCARIRSGDTVLSRAAGPRKLGRKDLLVFEVTDDATFGRMRVLDDHSPSADAVALELGGALVVDFTRYAGSPVGKTFGLISRKADLTGQFDRIELVGMGESAAGEFDRSSGELRVTAGSGSGAAAHACP